jgi:hypothetical protein
MARKFRYDPERDEVVEVPRAAPRGERDWKPLACEAMAFDGNTVQEAKALDAKLGAPDVDYDHLNRPVFHDKQTYDRYLKAHGYYNKSSGGVGFRFAPGELERAVERVRG